MSESIPGYKISLITDQPYELRKSCGRLMGVVEFVDKRHIEDLKITEYLFKKILWFTEAKQNTVVLRLNYRACGSMANILFKPISSENLVSSYPGLKKIE